jgi:hypothetical protein
MGFLELVTEVARLAEARNSEQEAFKTRYGVEECVHLGSEEDALYMSAARPTEQRLRQYLEGLDEQNVLKLEAVMYGGREKDADFRGLKEHLSATKEDAIETRLGKMPLGEYLIEGLVLAQQKWIDLEGPL